MVRKTIGRFAVGAIVTSAALVAGAPLASAAPPGGPPDDFTLNLPAGIACDFELRLQSTDSNTHAKTFKNGRSITAGRGAVLTFTNLTASPTKSLTINSNGSVSKTTPNADGTNTVQSTGHNVLILFPSDVPAGPSTTLFVGRVVYTDAGGTFTLQSTSGKQTDICAQLT
jgi:hypothetical protein